MTEQKMEINMNFIKNLDVNNMVTSKEKRIKIKFNCGHGHYVQKE